MLDAADSTLFHFDQIFQTEDNYGFEVANIDACNNLFDLFDLVAIGS
jgi:hypothetical protein